MSQTFFLDAIIKLEKEKIKELQKQKRKIYIKQYKQRPEVKLKNKLYHQRPEVKLRQKLYYQRPEIKIKNKLYQQQYKKKKINNKMSLNFLLN